MIELLSALADFLLYWRFFSSTLGGVLVGAALNAWLPWDGLGGLALIVAIIAGVLWGFIWEWRAGRDN